MTTTADAFRFFRAWLAAPRQVSAIAPSSPALARRMVAEIGPETGSVLELGPGTGAVTRALLERGVPPERVTLVEVDPALAEILSQRFAACRVLCADAIELLHSPEFAGADLGAVVSGLPLLSIPPDKVEAILAAAFDAMRPDGAFYQVTYGPRCSVPATIRARLGLRATRVGFALANLPPASVYRLTQPLEPAARGGDAAEDVEGAGVRVHGA